MHGPLSEIGLIEVLQLLERGGRSGVLSITGAHPAEPCQLHILEGEIVALEPLCGDTATGRALVARHLISEVEATDDPGVVARPIARQLRAQLAAQALGAMLHWRRGRFDFVAGVVAPGPQSLAPDARGFEQGVANRLDFLLVNGAVHQVVQGIPAEAPAHFGDHEPHDQRGDRVQDRVAGQVADDADTDDQR